MATHPSADPELKSFVSTQLLFTRMGDSEATAALEFLSDSETSAAPLEDPAELVGV
ncbi:hypothetical protein [Arthrobacter sp. UYCo732]|uniref:hypothetical protein n=1 Tax=Arthrobacter sp. UYCo732 TaxID=3156336 RepID=UPI0033953964